MINRSFFLLIPFLLASPVQAKVIHIPHLQFTSNTHIHTPIELKPTSFDKSYKVASVCFLGSGDGCGGGDFGKGDEPYEIDTTKQCMNEGFVNSCSTGYCMDHSCPYNGNYGKCLKENCPTNSSTTCTGAVDGKNACGVDCKKCCVTTCPSGYDYSESQLTGSSGNGWVKDGNDYCDHCTRGKLYKRKAASVPSGYTTCSCGGSSPFNSGGLTYYASCNCCSNCSGYNDNTSSCRYGYNSCRDNCTGQTRYQCKACDNSCSGSINSIPSCSDGYNSRTTQCGDTCYECKDCYCRDLHPYIPSNHCNEATSTYDECGFRCYYSHKTKLFERLRSARCDKSYNTLYFGNYMFYDEACTIRHEYSSYSENYDYPYCSSDFIRNFISKTTHFDTLQDCQNAINAILGKENYIGCGY